MAPLLVYCFALISLTGSYPLQDKDDDDPSWLSQTDNGVPVDPPFIHTLHASLTEVKQNYAALSNRFQSYVRNTTSLVDKLQTRIGGLEHSLASIQAKPRTPVAFSAVVHQKLTHVSKSTTVVFDHVYYQSGTAYNKRTGVFTVPRDGVYLFSLFCHSSDAKTLLLAAKVDGHSRSGCVSEPAFAGEDDSGGNMFVAHLTSGQQVWVETYGNDDSSIYPSFTSLSGVLIHED